MQNINLKFQEENINLNLRDEVDISVMREIFKLREYKKIEGLIENAKHPILDVGAHAGFFSLYTRALNPKVKIFAIEPEKENLKMLEKNLEANKTENVEITTGAIARTTEKRILEVTSDNQNHFLKNSSTKSRTDKNDTWVESYSLSDFCEKNKIKKLSLIKMDIEGTEFEILESLKPEDFNLFENMIFEYHDSKNKNHKKLENILRENKFGVQASPSKFDKTMGFIFANKK